MIMFNRSHVHNTVNLGDRRADKIKCVLYMCKFVMPPVTERSQIA